MNKKYIDFYKKFILQTKTLSDGGVILNNVLKRGNYGSNGNTGLCIWTDSIC